MCKILHKQSVLIALILFISSMSYSQKVQLSPSSQIRLITCGPGQSELYAAFGHSAFRVVDPLNNIDYVYNYGVFDFNQPNFYLNFARGYLNYRLARNDYRRFAAYYRYYNRSIEEQILNLTLRERQKLFDFLEWNNLPENREYYYDYFYDNCATRLRDAIVKVFGDSVNFDGSYIKDTKSIRELTDEYLTYQPWGDLGIDICLGLPMDREATPYMFMYLPDYLQSGFDNATLLDKKLVTNTSVTFKGSNEIPEITFFTPLNSFIILFIFYLLLTAVEYFRKLRMKWLDVILFSVTGLLGIFLFLLWVATDHKAAALNMNLLWAMPLHIFIPVYLIKKSANKNMKRILIFSFLLSLLMAFIWFILPQDLHNSLFFINLTVILRTGYILFNNSRLIKK